MKHAPSILPGAPNQLLRMNNKSLQHNNLQGMLGTSQGRLFGNKESRSISIRRGIEAEGSVVRLLSRAGRHCIKQTHQHPYDILCDGWRLDVKTSHPSQATGQQRWQGDRWMFNLHHSGEPITACDFFVLRLCGIPDSPDGVLHLLLRGPFHAITFAVTTLTFSKTIPLVEAFNAFLRGEYGFNPSVEIKERLAEACHAY